MVRLTNTMIAELTTRCCYDSHQKLKPVIITRLPERQAIKYIDPVASTTGRNTFLNRVIHEHENQCIVNAAWPGQYDGQRWRTLVRLRIGRHRVAAVSARLSNRTWPNRHMQYFSTLLSLQFVAATGQVNGTREFFQITVGWLSW